MQLQNEFLVPAPPERLWGHLLDVDAIAPCVPGAELTEMVDDHTWRGRLRVQFGPVSMSFAGTVAIQERDREHFKICLVARGTEQKGRGRVIADVTSWLEPQPDGTGTNVRMLTDVSLTGIAAQMSRGVLPEVSRQITAQFAARLRDRMLEEGEAAPHTVSSDQAVRAPHAAAAPVSGLRLALAVVVGMLRAALRRLRRQRADAT